jgi:hypothetical protein
MRLYAALIALVSIRVEAQSQTAKSVQDIEDIEIGMPADLVIAGLTKQGYTLKDAFKGITGLSPAAANWQVFSKEKYTGEFVVQEGRVIGAIISVYDSRDTAPGSGSIELAEALYWIFYDNGLALPSKDRDWKETETDAHFTLREAETRVPGSSVREIFARMANGANYKIFLSRIPGEPSSVTVRKMAPFVKKK